MVSYKLETQLVMSSVFLTVRGQNKLLAITDSQCGQVIPYSFKIGIGRGLSPTSQDLVSPIYGPALVETYEYMSKDTGQKVSVIVCQLPNNLHIQNAQITELGIWDKQGDMIIGAVFDPPIIVNNDTTIYRTRKIAIPFYATGLFSALSLCVSSNTVTYRHEQTTPSQQWNIDHQLNVADTPSVQVIGFDGRVYTPTRIIHQPDLTILEFDNPVSGKAVLVF